LLKRLAILFLILGIISAVIFANTGSKTHSTAQKLLKPLIELQCRNELKASKIWQASSYLWSESELRKAQNNICGCVSENALNDVPTKDLLFATMDEDVKEKLVKQAVVNSIKGCVQEILR